MFQEMIISNKNRLRKKEYTNYTDFLVKENYLFDEENLTWYGGSYSIPKHSSFYNDILIKNDIDFLSRKDSLKFFLSKDGKYQLSSIFTKIYIVPVRKYLLKHKVFSKRLFKLLIHIKVFDSEKYRRISLIDNPTYSKIVFYLNN